MFELGDIVFIGGSEVGHVVLGVAPCDFDVVASIVTDLADDIIVVEYGSLLVMNIADDRYPIGFVDSYKPAQLRKED